MDLTPAELLRGPDGRYHCPKCPVATDAMGDLVDHASDAHRSPFEEWVARWSEYQPNPQTPVETGVQD